jgi:mRNA interferase HigB
MHVIARPAIWAFCARYADARDWLEEWWRIASRAAWASLHEVRIAYASADQVGKCLIFNVRGNKYRFIVRVSYRNPHSRGTLLVKAFLTHAEYNENRWKTGCL